MLVNVFWWIRRQRTVHLKFLILKCQFLMPKVSTRNLKKSPQAGFRCKIKIAPRFVLRNIETGGYRSNYAHENKTLFEKLHLLCTKIQFDYIPVKS